MNIFIKLPMNLYSTIFWVCKLIITLLMFMCSCSNQQSLKAEPDVSKTIQEHLKIIGFKMPLQRLNNFNEFNKKDGTWVEEEGNFLIITTYKNGLKDGTETIYIIINSQCILERCITYKKNQMTDATVYHRGNILFKVEHFGNNNKYPEFERKFKYIGYCKDYNENGNLEAEGWMLFGDVWIADCEEIGNWKIYDRNGNTTTVSYYPTNYN